MISALMGYLVAQGAMTKEQADEATGQLIDVLLPVIAALVTVVITTYNAWNAKKQQELLVTAQALPAGVSTEEVLAAAKSSHAPSPRLPRDVSPAKMSRSTTRDGDNDAA